MASIPPSASGKGGASLVGVAKLVMESAMKAGVPIDNKAAHSYAKKLGKLQTQAKKKGGSLGQVHYSVGKFMASHGRSHSSHPASAAAAAASSAVAASGAGAHSISVTDADLQIPALATSAAAAIRPVAPRPTPQSLEAAAADEKAKEAAAATAVASNTAASPRLKPKVSLRRLVSAAYMPRHLKPADEPSAVPTTASSSSSAATTSDAAATAATSSSSDPKTIEEARAIIKGVLDLGLGQPAPRRPETRLADSAKARAESPITFPQYSGGGGGAAKSDASSSSAKKMTPTDATISLSEFISRHVMQPSTSTSSTEAADSSSPSAKAAAILAENPAAVDLGVALDSAPKRRTTLGSLSATLSAAAAARQRLLEERRQEQLRAAAADKAPAAAAAAEAPTPTPAAPSEPAKAAPAETKPAAPSLSLGSLSAGFKLTEDDSPLFGDEQEIAARQEREANRKAAEKKRREEAAAAAALAAASAPTVSYTIPAAAPVAPVNQPTPVTPAASAAPPFIAQPYSAMVGAEASSTASAYSAAPAKTTTSAEDWEAQRSREMEALRKAEAEEEERRQAAIVEREHAALGEEWVKRQSELAARVLADVASGALKPKQPLGLASDVFHKYREDIFFLRDTEAIAKCKSIDSITGEALDAEGNVIATKPDWQVAKEVFERAAAAATITNPLPPYMYVMLRQKMRAAPPEERASAFRGLREAAATTNKSLAPLSLEAELAEMATRKQPLRRAAFLEKYSSIPTEKRMRLSLQIHAAALRFAFMDAEDPAEHWPKALADIDALTKARGPLRGQMERVLLRTLATDINRRSHPTVTKALRRHIVDVIAARFEAMKKEPRSRGGPYDPTEFTTITSTVSNRFGAASTTAAAATQQVGPDGQPVAADPNSPTASAQFIPSVLTYNVPIAIGGGAGGDVRNRLYMARALRGGQSRTLLQQLVQPAEAEASMLTSDEYATSLVIRRAVDADAIADVLRQAEDRGVDIHSHAIIAARISAATSAEEAALIIDEAETAKGESLRPSRMLVTAVTSCLRAHDFAHSGLIACLEQWRTADGGRGNRFFNARHRTLLLIAKHLADRDEEVAAEIIAGAVRTMEVALAGGLQLTSVNAKGNTTMITVTEEAVAALRDPSRDPLSVAAPLIVCDHTITPIRRRLLNACFAKLGRSPATENDAPFVLQTSAERTAQIEEAFEHFRGGGGGGGGPASPSSSGAPAGMGGGALRKRISVTELFTNGRASAARVIAAASADALAADSAALSGGAASSLSGGPSDASQAEVEMPFTEELLQHARDRNWAAAVALVPQFPTTVPPQQVGALTLIFNCVLSAAVEVPDVVESILSDMKKTNAVPNATTFNTVMSSFARSETKWKDALDIFGTMPAEVKDASSYSVALSIMNKHGMPEEAMAVFTNEVMKSGPKPSPILFGLALQAVHRHSWENAMTVFRALVKAHGHEAGQKEAVLSRIKKALEDNGRKEELAEVEALITAPAKKQKAPKGGAGAKGGQQQQQNNKNNSNNNKQASPKQQHQQQQQAKPRAAPAASSAMAADDDF